MSKNDCSSLLSTASYLYPIALHLFSILLTSRALQIQYRLREMFHPFFSLLLFVVLVSYNLCSIFAIICGLLVMFGSPAHIIIIFNFLYYFCYYYINGMMFCLVIERLVATIMMRTYEYNRRWWPLALTQPFAIALSIGNIFVTDVFSRSLTLLSLYGVIILCLVVLLSINYRITTALAGTGASLSARYQITENIRTIRVVLPAVLFDALVSVVDVCGTVFFNLHYTFNIDRCTDDVYIKSFYGFTTLSAIFEFLVPLSLLLSHPAYRRHSLLLYERQPLSRIQHSVVKDKTLPKVVNVLGIEITNAGEQAYFENLSRVWNLRL
ncbi:hypothetical protein RB195_012662 [Necator americanus]|uniref:Serpentine receptor class gamma n=1 Tax=Necator americanus TaxID=51031 RepID=A0ABR1DS45_NECAM